MLPDLEEGEKFYVCVQARKKYCPELMPKDKTHLSRFMARKDDLAKKIYQRSGPVDSYTTKGDKVIPLSAMAVYMTPNPRSETKASYELIVSLAHGMKNKHLEPNGPTHTNPHALALTQLHKAKSRSSFVVFDVDFEGNGDLENAPKSVLTVDEVKKKTIDLLGEGAAFFIRTRGGVHVLVKPKDVKSKIKNWYPILCRELNVDQSGDLMIPIPGCVQGGHIPTLV